MNTMVDQRFCCAQHPGAHGGKQQDDRQREHRDDDGIKKRADVVGVGLLKW
jgi:hypothetical protein